MSSNDSSRSASPASIDPRDRKIEELTAMIQSLTVAQAQMREEMEVEVKQETTVPRISMDINLDRKVTFTAVKQVTSLEQFSEDGLKIRCSFVKTKGEQCNFKLSKPKSAVWIAQHADKPWSCHHHKKTDNYAYVEAVRQYEERHASSAGPSCA